ncbi:hypothetical protein BG004_007367 [Podila humilis]|nr:hypothetical protein BG004_007367 [Podila humilis]
MDSLEQELFGSDTESSDSDNLNNDNSNENDVTSTDIFQNDPLYQSIMESTTGDDPDALASSTYSVKKPAPIHTKHPYIEGLSLHTNVLSHQDQSQLMTSIVDHNFFKGGTQNQAMCFGKRDLSWLDWFETLLKNYDILNEPYCHQDWTLREPLFDQCILNLYKPGDGIKPHVDLARFEDGIVIVSLLSAITMDFYSAVNKMTANDPVDGGANPYTHKNISSSSSSEQDRQPAHSMRLEPGSIITLQGPARYEWEHGIQESTQDLVREEWVRRKTRVSITLRKMRPQAWEIGPSATENGIAGRT